MQNYENMFVCVCGVGVSTGFYQFPTGVCDPKGKWPLLKL